ncbi:MAG: MFS transporter [Cyclobacteriaceae bacterium]|nr:MFS transporter [Cyclobacteriaceae bacterium]
MISFPKRPADIMLWNFLMTPSSRAAGMAFFSNSLMIGTWFTLIPIVKSNLQLSDGQLGLALLGMPVGGIVAMPASTLLIRKYSAGITTLAVGLIFFWLFILPVTVSSIFTLAMVLMVAGMLGGIMGIGINATASIVEKKLGKSIMSTCHGFWSLGAMLGAGSAGIIHAAGLPPVQHMMLVAVLVSILMLVHLRSFISIRDEVNQQNKFSKPTRPVLILSTFLFCMFMTEGAIADWAAVYITSHLNGGIAIAGWGFGTFSLFMALGRFQGDILIPKYGKRTVFSLGMTLGLTGILIFLLTGKVPLALTGLAIAGIGFSCIVPLIISAAASVKSMSVSEAIATVSVVGSIGLMIGPPLIGFIAEVSSLQTAFFLLPLLAMYLLIAGRKYI